MMLNVLARRWFPLATTITDEMIGDALFLERRETEKLETAVNNGICRALQNH